VEQVLIWAVDASGALSHAALASEQARAEAERLHGPLVSRPFLVTDNGSSSIPRRFVQHVAGQYSHVRIRYRTPTQLGLLERFHQTLKQEETYWRLYESSAHARECIGQFRSRYSAQRPHWALVPEAGGDPLTPQEVYVSGCRIAIPKWQTWAKAAKAKLDQMLGQTAERMAS
jgi:transposase InsO family protein